ncbi:MAG: hypothetical protein AAGF93_16295, partial [Cyanobacteria bacterium P01_H01_bin.105]
MTYSVDVPNVPPTLPPPDQGPNLAVTDQVLLETTPIVTPPVVEPTSVSSRTTGSLQPMFARSDHGDQLLVSVLDNEHLLQIGEISEQGRPVQQAESGYLTDASLAAAEQTITPAESAMETEPVENEVLDTPSLQTVESIEVLPALNGMDKRDLLKSPDIDPDYSSVSDSNAGAPDTAEIFTDELDNEERDRNLPNALNTTEEDNTTVSQLEELEPSGSTDVDILDPADIETLEEIDAESTDTEDSSLNETVPEEPAVESVNNDALLETFEIFPVGVSVDERDVLLGELVKGKIDGSEAVDFDNWLIPYDVVVQALRLQVDVEADGQLKISSPGLVTRLDPDTIRTDDDLGLVFSVKDLKEQFQVDAEFDISNYAVRLLPPWVVGSRGSRLFRSSEVQLEGLPLIEAPGATVTALEQELDIVSNGDRDTTYGGNVAAVGTFRRGSWYLNVEQPDFTDSRTWNLSEAQYYRPTNRSDIVLGSQGPFWDAAGSNDLWGATYVQRQGYDPKDQRNGSADVGQRLQSGN